MSEPNLDWIIEFDNLVKEIELDHAKKTHGKEFMDTRKDWLESVILIQKAKVVAQHLIEIGKQDAMERIWDFGAPKIMPRPFLPKD